MIFYSFIFFIFKILFSDIAQLFKKEDLSSFWEVGDDLVAHYISGYYKWC